MNSQVTFTSSKRSAVVKVAFYIAFLVPVSGFLAWSTWLLFSAQSWNPLVYQQIGHFEGYFPAKFGDLKPVKVGPLLGACSGVLFKLERKVATRMYVDGAAFFRDADQPRRAPKDPELQNYKWNETPTPKHWNQEGRLPHGVQAIDLERDLADKIYEAANNPSAFYTKPTTESEMLIFPKLGLALFAYCD